MYYVVAVIQTDLQILQHWWEKHRTLSGVELSEYARSQKSDPCLNVMGTSYKFHLGQSIAIHLVAGKVCMKFMHVLLVY